MTPIYYIICFKVAASQPPPLVPISKNDFFLGKNDQQSSNSLVDDDVVHIEEPVRWAYLLSTFEQRKLKRLTLYKYETLVGVATL